MGEKYPGMKIKKQNCIKTGLRSLASSIHSFISCLTHSFNKWFLSACSGRARHEARCSRCREEQDLIPAGKHTDNQMAQKGHARPSGKRQAGTSLTQGVRKRSFSEWGLEGLVGLAWEMKRWKAQKAQIKEQRLVWFCSLVYPSNSTELGMQQVSRQ